jgi:ribosomal protein S3
LAQLAGDEAGVAFLTGVEVTATSDGLRVDIVTARPGVLIGPAGSTVAQLRSELAAVVRGRVALNIVPSAEE